MRKIFSPCTEEFTSPEILLEEASPNCPITATVEQDNRVAYFYLWGPEDSTFGVKSCWIRNLGIAPEKTEMRLMDKGIPTMLRKEFCKFPEGQEKLDKDELSILWLEEGDGAALLYMDEIVSVIPGWSGIDGFSGYARDCVGKDGFCWELPQSGELIDRIEESDEFWESWDGEVNPFQKEQPRILRVYEEFLGPCDRYYAIDGNIWPPKALYLRNGDSKIVFATVGLSLLPQPVAEMYANDRTTVNRIELGLMLDADTFKAEVQTFAEWISGQTSIPWDNITFLGEGHSINFPLLRSKTFDNVLLTKRLDVLPKIEIGSFRNSKINFLWMVPISSCERQSIIDEGSKPVLNKLNALGPGIFSPYREEVV